MAKKGKRNSMVGKPVDANLLRRYASELFQSVQDARQEQGKGDLSLPEWQRDDLTKALPNWEAEAERLKHLHSPYGHALAIAMNGMNIYGGTAPEHVVARRRRRNKAARKARRVHRLRQG